MGKKKGKNKKSIADLWNYPKLSKSKPNISAKKVTGNPFDFIYDKNIDTSKEIGLCKNSIIDASVLITLLWNKCSREKVASNNFMLPIKMKIIGTNMVQKYNIDGRLYGEIEYFYLITDKPSSYFPSLSSIHDPKHKYSEAFVEFDSDRDRLKPKFIIRDKIFLDSVLPESDSERTIYRISKNNFKKVIWKLMCCYDGEFVKNEDTGILSILTPLTSIDNTNFFDEIKVGYAVMQNSDVYEIEFSKKLKEFLK